MTVAQLKSSLDADELAHWIAYDALDPIGEEEAERREREAIAESNRRSHEAMKAQIAKLLEKQSSKKELSNE